MGNGFDLTIYLPIIVGGACIAFSAAIFWLLFRVGRLNERIEQIAAAVKRIWDRVLDR